MLVTYDCIVLAANRVGITSIATNTDTRKRITINTKKDVKISDHNVQEAEENSTQA